MFFLFKTSLKKNEFKFGFKTNNLRENQYLLDLDLNLKKIYILSITINNKCIIKLIFYLFRLVICLENDHYIEMIK